MRVQLKSDSLVGEFSKLLLEIRNGQIQKTSNGDIEIPYNLANLISTVHELVDKVYPDILNISKEPGSWLCERAILSPKNETSDNTNNYTGSSRNNANI